MVIEASKTEKGLIQAFSMFCVSLRFSGIACTLYTVYQIKLSIIKWEVCMMLVLEIIMSEKMEIAEFCSNPHPIRILFALFCKGF
jgi:hypothetical protein